MVLTRSKKAELISKGGGVTKPKASGVAKPKAPKNKKQNEKAKGKNKKAAIPPGDINGQPQSKKSKTGKSSGGGGKSHHKAEHQNEILPDQGAQMEVQEAEHTKALKNHVLYPCFSEMTKAAIDTGEVAKRIDLVSPDFAMFQLLQQFKGNLKEQGIVVAKDYINRVQATNLVYFEVVGSDSIMKDFEIYLQSCGTLSRAAGRVTKSQEQFENTCKKWLKRELKNIVAVIPEAPSSKVDDRKFTKSQPSTNPIISEKNKKKKGKRKRDEPESETESDGHQNQIQAITKPSKKKAKKILAESANLYRAIEVRTDAKPTLAAKPQANNKKKNRQAKEDTTAEGVPAKLKREMPHFEEEATGGLMQEGQSTRVIELSDPTVEPRDVSALVAANQTKELKIKELERQIEELGRPRHYMHEDDMTDHLAGLRQKNILLEADLDATRYVNKRLWDDVQHIAKLREQNKTLTHDLETAKKRVQQLEKFKHTAQAAQTSVASREVSGGGPGQTAEVKKLREANIMLARSLGTEKAKAPEREKHNADLDRKVKAMTELVGQISGIGRWIDMAASNAMAGAEPLRPMPVLVATYPIALHEPPLSAINPAAAATPQSESRGINYQDGIRSQQSSSQGTQTKAGVFKAPPSGIRVDFNRPDPSTPRESAIHAHSWRNPGEMEPLRFRQSVPARGHLVSQNQGLPLASSHPQLRSESRLPMLFPYGPREGIQVRETDMLARKEPKGNQPTSSAPKISEKVYVEASTDVKPTRGRLVSPVGSWHSPRYQESDSTPAETSITREILATNVVDITTDDELSETPEDNMTLLFEHLNGRESRKN